MNSVTKTSTYISSIRAVSEERLSGNSLYTRNIENTIPNEDYLTAVNEPDGGFLRYLFGHPDVAYIDGLVIDGQLPERPINFMETAKAIGDKALITTPSHVAYTDVAEIGQFASLLTAQYPDTSHAYRIGSEYFRHQTETFYGQVANDSVLTISDAIVALNIDFPILVQMAEASGFLNEFHSTNDDRGWVTRTAGANQAIINHLSDEARAKIDGVTGSDFSYVVATSDKDENFQLVGTDGSVTSVLGFDTDYGVPGDDYLDSGTDADSVEGGQGDDSIGGREGKDTLNGGEGSDYLHRSAGEDRVVGSSGEDRLLGGDGGVAIVDGADAFNISGCSTETSILGFDHLEGDSIVVAEDEGFRFSGRSLTNDGASLPLQLENGIDEQVSVIQVSLDSDFESINSETIDSFIFMTSESAPSGDTFVFERGENTIMIQDFESGTDTIDFSGLVGYVSRLSFDLNGATVQRVGRFEEVDYDSLTLRAKQFGTDLNIYADYADRPDGSHSTDHVATLTDLSLSEISLGDFLF